MEKTLHDRLKEARKTLGMSQGYVATLMNLHRSVITAIELGTRKVTSDELKVFSELYGLTMDELMYGTDTNVDEKIFARTFSALSEIDKQEIMNLIEFKHRLKKAMR